MANHSRLEISVGSFVAAGLAIVAYLAISLGNVRLLSGDRTTIIARFSSIGDLRKAAPVRIAGVNVGQVGKIQLADFVRTRTTLGPNRVSRIHSNEDTMTRSLTVLFVAAASLSTRSAGAEKLSRADVMKRAAQHPATEAAHSQIDQVRAQKRQADALRWPRISLSLGLVPSLRATLVEGSQVDSVERATDYRLGEVTPGFTGDLTIMQPLYTFGKIAQRQRAAELGIGAHTAQARMRQADVAVEGAELYEKYLLARDLQRFLEDTDHVLVRSIAATEERLAANTPDVSQHDLLRLKTARGPLIVGLHQAQAGTRQAEAGLRAYFGLRDGTAIEPADARLEAIPAGKLGLAELVRRAYSDRPELVALADGAAAFDALARAERSGYLPDIVALGFVSGAYTVDRDPVESRFVYDPARHFVPGIGLGLRWELWGDLAGAACSAIQPPSRRRHGRSASRASGR